MQVFLLPFFFAAFLLLISSLARGSLYYSYSFFSNSNTGTVNAVLISSMSWFSKYNPAPSFPAYSGPHEVGTVDVEIPVADLPAQSFTPDEAPATVAFRLFYPCEKPTTASRPVRWIPQPQRQMVAAFAKFLGASSRLAELFA